MSQDYNPDSVDAVLSRIENKLNNMDSETQRYRQENNAKGFALSARVDDLEGDRKKITGLAIGAGVGSGSLFAGLGKLFGGP